ncbi:MAG: hypothetical protein ACKVP5_03455 [Aestuariivirga sp.]
MWRGVGLWLVIMALETVHGVLRGLYLVPAVGEATAGRIGLATGTAIVLIVTLLFIRWTGLRTIAGLAKLGCAWATLTLAFEIGIGLLRGFDVPRIWVEIDPIQGGTMLLSLAIMFLAPMAAARLRG